jgi:hypothetical protein
VCTTARGGHGDQCGYGRRPTPHVCCDADPGRLPHELA